MNKLKEYIEKYHLIIIIFLCLLFSVNMCSNRNSLDKIYKSNNAELSYIKDSLGVLSNKINNIPIRKEFKLDNQILMYEFLQFEDDVDKGKISLSQLKLKLEELRKIEETRE